MSMTQQWAREINEEEEEQRWKQAHAPLPISIDISALSVTRVSSDPQIASKQSVLLGRLFTIQDEVAALSKEVNAAEVVELKKHHKLLWAAARKAKDALAAMTAPVAHAEGMAREAGFDWNRQFAKLAQIKASIPAQSDYPTDEEMEAWSEKVDKQTEKLQEVEREMNSAKQHLAELQLQQSGLQANFAKAKAAVKNSQGRIDVLEGKTVTSRSMSFSESMGLRS